MASKELFHLLRVLDERDTGLSRDDVAWAFEPARKAETEDWVKKYLSPATLLTKEEHAFHERFGEFTPQIHSAASGRPLSDEDFEHAITSLQSSTAAIDAQCQLMEAQKRALLDFKARNSNGNQAQPEPSKQQQKLLRDKAQLDLELSEISSSLQERLRSSMAQAEAASTNLPTKLDRLLEKDDRMLDGLQKILPKLQGTDTSNDTLEEVDKLCRAFTILEAKAIRAKIDSVYRDNLHSRSSEPVNGHTPPNEQEQQSIRAELEELSTEIDGLITLVADNHYRLPITQRLGTARSESQGEAARWSEYLSASLHFLSARLESLTEHYQHVNVHRSALLALSQTLEKTLAAPSKQSNEAPPVSAVNKTAQAQKGLKPLRLVQANLPEAPDATAQLLRHLDIRPGDSAKLSDVLQSARTDEQHKLAAFAASTDGSLAKLLGESLGRADGDARDLLTAVFAVSAYGERRMVEEDVQREIDVLEGRTQEVGERMRSLDVEGLAGDVRRLQRGVLRHG